MDATVNDFLSEINDLVPLKDNKSVWKECLDQKSGFCYYWNTKSDEVTWNKPPEFIPIKQRTTINLTNTNERKPPLIPNSNISVDSVKIYKVGNTNQPIISNKVPDTAVKKTNNKKFVRPCSDSEDEKIVLISSYGGDSESDSEEGEKSQNVVPQKAKKIQGNISDEEDDVLRKNQTSKQQPPALEKTVKSKNEISGFSLVAGYSDSEEEQENEEIKSVFAPKVAPLPENKVSHSTLFPITKPIDIAEFLKEAPAEKPIATSNETTEFDSKAFQRKKRIGVALINNPKKVRNSSDDENERKGFGYSVAEKSESNSLFDKGKVMFVKSDVLNPDTSVNAKTVENELKDSAITSKAKSQEIEENYSTLKEKLTFLSEGRPEVSPVQIMMIQAETLFLAMNKGALQLLYLQRWLNDTCDDLIKLEKEAAPDGWTLQWDRSHKRYYYHNQATGEGQWEYPQPDVVRCDEAMDISTTPPPVAQEPIHMSPPLPPVIRSPTPPPPPIISCSPIESISVVPLPPDPPKSKFQENGEPLPPGVDIPEVVPFKEKDKTLSTALDSFYSDIAAIENSTSPPVPDENKIETPDTIILAPEVTKKKKKSTKVKLTQGLAMKKKGVSKMVEKWKHVQMNFE